MPNRLDNITRGLAALDVARTKLDALATADIPWVFKSRSAASKLRTEAVEQARTGRDLLSEAMKPDALHRIDANITGLEQAELARRSLDHWIPHAKASLHVADLDKDILRAGAREALEESGAWTDPAVLRTALADVIDLVDDSYPQSAIVRARLLAVVESPAMRELAPAMPEQFPIGYPSSSPSELFSGFERDKLQFGRSVLREALAGSYASEAARQQAIREVATTADLTDGQAARRLATLVGRDEGIPWASKLLGYADLSDVQVERATAIESTRLAVTGEALDVARLEQDVAELLEHAGTGGQLDVADWARLRSRLFDHGMLERMGLRERAKYWDKEGASAEYATYAWHDAPKHGSIEGRDRLVALWNDQRYLARVEDDQLRADTLDLVDRWPASKDAVERRLFELGVAERLQLPTKTGWSGAQQAIRVNDEAGYQYVARWGLQLEGVLGNPERTDARVLEMIRRGTDLDWHDRARLDVLLRTEGVAQRLGLPMELPGESTFLDPSRARSAPTRRYLRLWHELDAGRLHTPQDAAVRARQLIETGDLDDLEVLHRIGTAAVDGGGAAELGLPLQLAGIDAAAESFRGSDGAVIGEEIGRYAHAWRGLLAGQRSDPELLRQSIRTVAATGKDQVDSVAPAIRDVFVHGFDLPGAPLDGIMHARDRWDMATFATVNSIAAGFVRKWAPELELMAEPLQPAQRMERIRELASLTELDDSQFGALFAHVASMPDDALRTVGLDPVGLREALGTRARARHADLHSYSGRHAAQAAWFPGERARLLLRDRLGIERFVAEGSDPRAAVRGHLEFDHADRAARAKAYVALVDVGLLAQALPIEALPVIVRVERTLGASDATVAQVDEAVRLAKAVLDPDWTLSSLVDDLVDADLRDAHDVLRTVLDQAGGGRSVTFAHRAKVISTALPQSFESTSRWLDDAGVLLRRDEAAPLGAVRDELLGRIDVNIQRLAGKTPEGEVRGYSRHPDYAELGRIRSGVELAGRLAEQAETAGSAAGQAADSGAGKVTW